MKVLVHENGMFMVNSFLIINEENNSGFILDPGGNMDGILDHIDKEKINLEAILTTHGHIDHVEGVNKVQERFKVPFYANELDKELIESVTMQANMFGVPNPGNITIDKNLPENGSITVAGIKMDLMHTPGHSKGSVSIKIDDTVFVGDALFNMSIGRTDLPGGDYEELISSIKKELFTLPEETRVLSGHGPETTIGREKSMNPFFR